MVFIALLEPSISAAQPTKATSSRDEAGPEGRGQARAHFERGHAHFRDGHFRLALRELELAVGSVPSAELWFDIGRCHEELGELGDAVEHYRLYLRDRVEAPDRAEVERRIERIEAQRRALVAAPAGPPRGVLRVDTAVEGALVVLAGEPVGYTPVERLLALPPGRHSIVLSHAGYVPFRGAVVVEEGSLTLARADLQPLPAPSRARSARAWTWLLSVTAIAALGTGVGTAIAASEARSARQRASRDGLREVSDVSLASGLVLAVGAALCFFLEGSDMRDQADSRQTKSVAWAP